MNMIEYRLTVTPHQVDVQVINQSIGSAYLICTKSRPVTAEGVSTEMPWKNLRVGQDLAYHILAHHFMDTQTDQVARRWADLYRSHFWRGMLEFNDTPMVLLTTSGINMWFVNYLLEQRDNAPPCWLAKRLMTPCGN